MPPNPPSPLPFPPVVPLPFCPLTTPLEFPLYEIAQSNAKYVIPEGQGIKKGFAIRFLELKTPGFAAILRLVNARRVTGPGAQKVGRGFSEGFDIAEVEVCRTGNGSNGPGFAGVGGSTVGFIGATIPSQNARAGSVFSAVTRPDCPMPNKIAYSFFPSQ